mmetsp:Transcript_37691/g.72545  ORF Transcript_37691/g.72545 Transcript_37691/m.72545 type:complete len:143 (+) Transcript_37691:109-537(+)
MTDGILKLSTTRGQAFLDWPTHIWRQLDNSLAQLRKAEKDLAELRGKQMTRHVCAQQVEAIQNEFVHAVHGVVVLQWCVGIMDSEPAELKAMAELAKPISAASAWLQLLSNRLGMPKEVWQRVIDYTLPTQISTAGNERKPK